MYRALRGASPRAVLHDVAAGLVLSTVLIPAGMAYAQASGLSPVTGLYATLVPLIVYAILGPSPLLVIGPDSALTALIAAVVVPLSHGDPSRAAGLAAALALVTGVYCLLGASARLGFLTDLLSLPVRHGYMAGMAVVVMVGQLPRLFGFTTKAVAVLDGVELFVSGLADGRGNRTVVVLGVTSLAVMLLFRWRKYRFPAALLVVVGAIVAVTVFDLADEGVALVGRLPDDLVRPTLPHLRRGEVADILTGSIGLALVAFADSSVLSRTYAARGRYSVDANHELAVIGAANLVTGLFNGFPVSASASRTAVAESAGGRTQLTGFVSALVVAGLLLGQPGLLRNLPIGVLAALVISAALSLVPIGPALRLYQTARGEFGLMAITFVGVVVGGAIRGVGVAIGVSLLNFLRKAWRPHMTQLVRVDGLKGYHDAARHPEGRRIPGLVLFRFDAPLFFANAEVFRQQLLRLVGHTDGIVHRVVVTAEPITDVDATAATMLEELHDELARRGIVLAFAELKGHVRDRLVPYGLVDLIGRARFYATIGEAVKGYLAETDGVTWVDWEESSDSGDQADGAL